MTKFLTLLVSILLASQCLGQLSLDNKQLLRSELAKLVNELRVSKGAKSLLFSDTLKLAAEDHSKYMAKKDELTHHQKSSVSATPQRRVKKRGGKDFEIVGENVLYSTPQDFPLKKKEIILLAQEMFDAWKNSPGHYANMIDPEYELGDFGFKYNAKKKIVYATQVFGKRGYLVPNQLSENAFNLREAASDCDKSFKHMLNLVANMGNSLKLDGKDIVFYHHDKASLNQMLSGPKDGIAIDIISRDQVLCGSPNKLDASPIYDGILLEPVWSSTIMNDNFAESNYRVKSRVGTLPEELIGKEISASIILIKDGKKCKYLVPNFVPSDRYDLRPITPFLVEHKDVELIDSGIVFSEELNYDFSTNITKAQKTPSLNLLNEEVHSISIKSYSSVEGSVEGNESLHNNRAQFIKSHLNKKLKQKNIIYTVEAKENWEKMMFQLDYFHQEELGELPHDSIKQIIALREVPLPWDSLLHAQRRSTANINYLGKVDSTMSTSIWQTMNLRTALINQNMKLANRALYLMYHEKNLDLPYYFENQIYDELLKHPELVQNTCALFSKMYKNQLFKTTEYIYHWMKRKDELLEEAKFNLLHLYTLTGEALLDNWDVSAQRLSNVIHPNKVNMLAYSGLKNELLLNLHLTFIQYFGQINDGVNITKSFNFISDHFKAHSLSQEDDVDLALFFNSWSMYGYTINHLAPLFEKEELNEDGVFVLAQTMNFYNEGVDEEILEEVHKKAVELNKTRWCKWVNIDFQILRNHKIKRAYCEKCQE